MNFIIIVADGDICTLSIQCFNGFCNALGICGYGILSLFKTFNIHNLSCEKSIIIEKSIHRKYGNILNFIDFEKAFDSVHQESLWKILESYGIPDKIIEIIKSLYDDAESCVKINESENTIWFKIKTGVRQGCILSPLLFVIAIDWVLKQAIKDERLGIKLNYKHDIEDLDFADDIVLTSDNIDNMQNKTNKIDEISKTIGLKINAKKTNIMVINPDSFTDNVDIKVNNKSLEKVNNFTYLGSKISDINDIMIEINNRISKAACAMKQLNNIWKNKAISLKTKMKLYRSNVITSLMYGSEAWQLTEGQEAKINTFDYTCLRKILKISWKDKVTNEEIRRTVNIPSVVQLIKRQRLSWFGHVIRMPRNRYPKMILNWEPKENNTGRGRPATSWEETIKRTLEENGLQYEEAFEKAKHRKEWNAFLLPIASHDDWSNR